MDMSQPMPWNIPYTILVNNQLDAQFFFLIHLFQFSTCFEHPLCSSSGESIVLIQYLVYVTVCRWLSSVQVWMEQTHQYKNIKTKLYKNNAAIWYNKTCRMKQLTPSYISIKVNGSSIQTCTLDGHLHTMTYTRYHINTIDSPNDKHSGARNM
jgi:hypothetical protein